MVVYNTQICEAFVSPVVGWSSGGLAQLGEHYVRNVGVGGSTPLPSTIFLTARDFSNPFLQEHILYLLQKPPSEIARNLGRFSG